MNGLTDSLAKREAAVLKIINKKGREEDAMPRGQVRSSGGSH